MLRLRAAAVDVVTPFIQFPAASCAGECLIRVSGGTLSLRAPGHPFGVGFTRNRRGSFSEETDFTIPSFKIQLPGRFSELACFSEQQGLRETLWERPLLPENFSDQPDVICALLPQIQ